MKYKMIIINVMIILIFSISVNALGVSTLFYIDHPLEIYPGQITDFEIIISNEDLKEINVRGNITQGSDIAIIIDKKEIYMIPPITKKYPIKISVKVPTNYTIGKEHILKISFEQINKVTDEKMIDMGIGITRDIPIKIIKKQNSIPLYLLVILSISVFMIVTIIINKIPGNTYYKKR